MPEVVLSVSFYDPLSFPNTRHWSGMYILNEIMFFGTEMHIGGDSGIFFFNNKSKKHRIFIKKIKNLM
jgi:hypothetical protein